MIEWYTIMKSTSHSLTPIFIETKKIIKIRTYGEKSTKIECRDKSAWGIYVFMLGLQFKTL